MKYLLVILLLSTVPFAWAENKEGTIAGQAWLNIIDNGNYAKSWQQADQYFKAQLSEDAWNNTLTGIRTPLGDVKSRIETSSQIYTSLPGAPDGEYLVVTFQTIFEHKQSAVETLTLSKNNGQWRSVGYFIK